MRRNTYRSGNRAMNVTVAPEDQKRLNGFFKQELAFYNTLIGIFESRVRAFPKSILEITPVQENLFADLSYHNLNLSKLVRDPNNWPQELAQHKATVFNKDNKCILTPAQVLMFEAVGREKFVIIPETKRNMARAVLEYFKEQAEILSNPANTDKFDISYRAAPRNISQVEFAHKRHAQIPLSQIKFKFNFELEQTEILTPLNSKPMTIPAFNLNEFTGWTTMILKQESGKHVDWDTPWVADFKNTGNRYLITYNDFGSRNSNKR